MHVLSVCTYDLFFTPPLKKVGGGVNLYGEKEKVVGGGGHICRHILCILQNNYYLRMMIALGNHCPLSFGICEKVKL